MQANKITKCFLVNEARRRVFGKYNDQAQLIERPRSFVFRRRNENFLGNRIDRLILLPPDGCTADEKDALAAHPETRNAKAEILGGVAPGLRGFRPVREQIMFRYSETRNENEICKVLKSWNNPFYVVKDNCFGFFHNLINMSNEWVLLRLEKEFAQLKEFKTIDDVRHRHMALPITTIRGLEKECNEVEEALFNVLRGIDEVGSRIFYFYPDQVSSLLRLLTKFLNDWNSFPSQSIFGDALELLIDALNMRETGQHEPCAVFELLHKIGKIAASPLVDALAAALRDGSAPPYYVANLLGKIGSQEAKEVLQQALGDENKREYAKMALRSLEKNIP